MLAGVEVETEVLESIDIFSLMLMRMANFNDNEKSQAFQNTLSRISVGLMICF